MAIITTPVPGFTGVSVGVNFTDGVGQTDDEVKLAYFRRHGYGIDVPVPMTEDDIARVAANEQAPESTPTPKPLIEHSKAELEAIATEAGIEFKAPINKAELVALIEAKQAE